MRPPKPIPRPDRVSLWRYVRLFRRDILSAQPERLFGAWMAEFRTPFFRSYLINQPELLDEVLKARPDDFPKSDRIGEGLRPLLGQSVFVTNGETWKRQRRIIDPAFAGGRLREIFPAMETAAEAAIARVGKLDLSQPVEVEEVASHIAADVIFRALFSIPIEDHVAGQLFHEFKAYQRSQPILNAAAFVRLPPWVPRAHRRNVRKTAGRIRDLIRDLTTARMAEIEAGRAPDDLATRIMTTLDPETGQTFNVDEMVDQVAIFLLAGHETSASALAWALYLLAANPDWQARVAGEAEALAKSHTFGELSMLSVSRDVFREALRLYPPVPMMVRETTCPEMFRNRQIKPGSQVVISPWHLHRHTRMWDRPDDFDPGRWATENGKTCQREAYLPFSAGPRVCPGAGFAMAEGVLMLSRITRAFHLEPDGAPPVPIAHLTVRARDGIWLRLTPRADQPDAAEI